MRRTEILSTELTPSRFRELSRLVQSPARDRDPRHTFYSYPAKFQATVPAYLVRHFSSAGELVLDPFGGGGTTAVCAGLQARKFMHYDLSPFSCLVALAKTAGGGAWPNFVSPGKPRSLLTTEEGRLLGPGVARAAEDIWGEVSRIRARHPGVAAAAAVGLMALLKACGRRDAEARRARRASEHLTHFERRLRGFLAHAGASPCGPGEIVRGSNHDLHLADSTVQLIVTSPPYPGVDVEYAQLQLQRRDLNRCFRSNLPLRIAESFFSGPAPAKRQLCEGGSEPGGYFENAERSLREMRRVLAPGRFAFVYCGFKTVEDQSRYEDTARNAGFTLLHRAPVLLSADRVASSRSLHHGRETSLMKRDVLFALRAPGKM